MTVCTRERSAYGGLAIHADLRAGVYVLYHGECKQPGTSGFVGEFLTLISGRRIITVYFIGECVEACWWR